MNAKLFYPGCCLFLLFFFGCQQEPLRLNLQIETEYPQVRHGVKKLYELSNTGSIDIVESNYDYVVFTEIDSANLDPEAFDLTVEDDVIMLRAGDPAGLMYGLLDIREQLQTGHRELRGKTESPDLTFRAIKFNLPWDSYRTGESLQLHYETCRDTSFWNDFLDMMAENRFNKLTLWNLHPFNYLVKTEKYPEACGFTDDEMAEWQVFWHTLFRMAKDRGIETYLVNWNIFVSPEFAKAHGVAEYSITSTYFVNQGDTSEIIKDYTREAVKEVIDTYPDLTGLGITLGEGMGGMTAEEREQWLLDSFIAGMRMASRKIKFIHRVPLSAGTGSGGSTSESVERMTRRTLDTLTCVDGPINIELKFNWSHGHSTPYLAKVHGGRLNDSYWNPLPENYALAWMIRNEDFFVLRWGQPDFIREHTGRNAHEYVEGYYVGSETYIPAKDYITSLEGASYRYAFERQWMYYKMWGRLLYNRRTPDSVFEQAFTNRFPRYGKILFSAQSRVSRVPLIIATYWNATWDFTLYSEGFLTMRRDRNEVGLIPLLEMLDKNPMDPSYMGIREFLTDEDAVYPDRITPLRLADSIDGFCKKALDELRNVTPGNNTDLLYEVSDIRTWAYLGLYFSSKLRAAVEYQKYLNTDERRHHDNSVKWLEKATDSWHQAVLVTKPVYEPMPLMHYTHRNQDHDFHWSKVENEVIEELNWLKKQ